jgi:hypothetical protein
MTRIFCAVLLAFPPLAAEPAPPWAGVPLATLPALGLGAPDLDQYASGWRAALPEGGFARLQHVPTVAEARAVFAGQARSAATLSLPPLAWAAPAGHDTEAVGDGQGFLVLRDANVVLTVRDPRGRAGDVARAIEAALVIEPPAAEPVVLDLGGRVLRWDACGRLIP